MILFPLSPDLLDMGQQLQNQNRVQRDAPLHLRGSGIIIIFNLPIYHCPPPFFTFVLVWFDSKHLFCG